MNHFWKIGLAMVAFLVLAGAAVGFVSAQTDSDVPGTGFLARLADKLGITQEELEEAIDETKLEMVDEAVAEDKLTEEQADRIRDRIESGEGLPPFRGPRFHFESGEGLLPFGGPWSHFEFGFGKGFAVGRSVVHIGAVLDEVAGLLGISVDELRDAMADGQSLAEIAEAHDVSAEELKAFLLSQVEERLAAAVENGGLSREQADEALEGASDQIDALINREGTICPQGGSDGRWRWCLPGGFGHFEWFDRPCEPEPEPDGIEGTTF
jgi:hypothetical protein